MFRSFAFHVFNSTAAILLLSGCAALGLASGSNPVSTGGATAVSDAVSNPSVFDYTTGSTKIAFLSPAALLADNPQMSAYVIREQCYFRTPDPLFFVPDADRQTTWKFAGRLNADRHFQALEYRSILTLGLTDGNSQLNTWPLELVSLADMPQVFLNERLGLPAQAKLSKDDQKELLQSYFQQSRQIQQVVTRLEAGYDPAAECAAVASR
jgi:hypothetical protein